MLFCGQKGFPGHERRWRPQEEGQVQVSSHQEAFSYCPTLTLLYTAWCTLLASLVLILNQAINFVSTFWQIYHQVFVKDPDGTFAREVPGANWKDDWRWQDPAWLLRHPGRSCQAAVENYSFIYPIRHSPYLKISSWSESNLIWTDENLFKGQPRPFITQFANASRTYLLLDLFKVLRFVHSYDFKGSINIK